MTVGLPSRLAAPEQLRRPRRGVRTWARWLAWGLGIGIPVTALLALVVTLFFSDRVIGPSMLRGLKPGDRVLVNPWAYSSGNPQRGDVVEVVPPTGPAGVAIKRVVGLPGDQLEIRPVSPGGPPAVFIRPDGTGGWDRLIEPYLGSAGASRLGCCDAAGRATTHPQPFSVPPGRYFVLGDNRNVSYDSMDYGPVTLSAIQGKVVWLVLPLGRFGAVGARPSLTPAHI